jgi:HEPN domain-containing protein
MNRTDLQRLAEERAVDALALLNAGRWSAAYYLAGYSVECALKACIAKRVRAEDFPDKKLATDSYTHDVQGLARIAQVEPALAARLSSDPTFKLNWAALQRWNEGARYQSWLERDARGLYRAVTDLQTGVLPWLKKYW